MPTQLSDIVQRLLDLAPDYLACSVEGAAYLDALGSMCQAAEDSAHGLRLGMTLEHARGSALDKWGRRVGMPRGSMDDTVYRRFIRAKHLAIESPGTAQDLSDVLRTALPFLADLDVVEVLPLGVSLQILTDEAPDAEMLARVRGLIRCALGASVRFTGAWGVRPAFAPDADLDPSYESLGLGLLAFDF